MSDMQQRRITIQHRRRDYEIAYSVRPGGSSSILYLHGLGSTKNDFEGALLVDELRDHNLVGFDFPGCGQSTNYYPEIVLGMDDLVAVARKLARELELKDLTVVGQSLGGLTGLLLARTHPEQVARFVNVEGNLTPTDCDIQSRDVFRHRFLGDEEAFFNMVQERLNDPEKPGFEDFVPSSGETSSIGPTSTTAGPSSTTLMANHCWSSLSNCRCPSCTSTGAPILTCHTWDGSSRLAFLWCVFQTAIISPG